MTRHGVSAKRIIQRIIQRIIFAIEQQRRSPGGNVRQHAIDKAKVPHSDTIAGQERAELHRHPCPLAACANVELPIWECRADLSAEVLRQL
ncbi:hypothetical protein [uncultured Tateyamaria sp.]|uniref:hypothetical protein n=1 Tax=uncultured Tateyamaria sp. TaxID=455651 RepID=UPI00261AA57D|nr:hypothetical protein [uncultured Tateyamaria sp.]